jgi:ribosome-associated toxin RatA of RatAB toxin-antitoxin module
MSVAVALPLSSPVTAEETPVVRLQTSARDYRIKAEMPVPLPPKTVYRICTDYESVDDNISLFKISRILKRDGNRVLVRQVHVIKVLFFEYETESVLEVEENPWKGFRFQEIEGDFRNHRGSWSFITERGGRSTLIRYETQAEPGVYIPTWLVVYFMKRDVREAFYELYRWIMKEAGHRRTRHKVAAK